MLRILTHRWLGVSCWVYVLSLTLAGLMFWMLPGSIVVHTWKFEGGVRYEGFTRDHRHLVITNQRTDRTVFHQLRLDTGECTTYLPLQHPDHQLDYQSLMKEQPSLRVELRTDSEGLVLVKPNGNEQSIQCKLDQISFVIRDMKSSMRRITDVRYLFGEGSMALSDNERWLIVTRQYAEIWQPLLQWAQKTFSWNPSYLSDGWRYTAAIIDLNTNHEIACHLHTHSQPRYAIHPEGLGFAVFDERVTNPPRATNVALLGLPSTTSVISWYGLPPGMAYHSLGQLGVIIATFIVPILLSLLLQSCRYWRRYGSAIIKPGTTR